MYVSSGSSWKLEVGRRRQTVCTYEETFQHKVDLNVASDTDQRDVTTKAHKSSLVRRVHLWATRGQVVLNEEKQGPLRSVFTYNTRADLHCYRKNVYWTCFVSTTFFCRAER